MNLIGPRLLCDLGTVSVCILWDVIYHIFVFFMMWYMIIFMIFFYFLWSVMCFIMYMMWCIINCDFLYEFTVMHALYCTCIYTFSCFLCSGRPCERCIKRKEVDKCVDVTHKKKGRPRKNSRVPSHPSTKKLKLKSDFEHILTAVSGIWCFMMCFCVFYDGIWCVWCFYDGIWCFLWLYMMFVMCFVMVYHVFMMFYFFYQKYDFFVFVFCMICFLWFFLWSIVMYMICFMMFLWCVMCFMMFLWCVSCFIMIYDVVISSTPIRRHRRRYPSPSPVTPLPQRPVPKMSRSQPLGMISYNTHHKIIKWIIWNIKYISYKHHKTHHKIIKWIINYKTHHMKHKIYII